MKDTKLAYFRKCAQNIASISFRGSFSNLSDISEMKNFTKLEGSDLSDTEIPDLEPPFFSAHGRLYAFKRVPDGHQAVYFEDADLVAGNRGTPLGKPRSSASVPTPPPG